VGNPEKFDKPYEEPIKNCIAASKSHVSVTAAADCVKTIGQLPFRWTSFAYLPRNDGWVDPSEIDTSVVL